MRSPSRPGIVTDLGGRAADPTAADALPAELEARIAALEHADRREDFDALSWIWMLLLGVVLPLVLVIVGSRL